MSDDSSESMRPDFDERLRQVTRKRQQRDPLEPAEDTLSLSSDAKDTNVFSKRPRKRPPVPEGVDEDRLIWLAMGLSGVALLIGLILVAFLYRHGNRVDRLQEAVALLEEQRGNADGMEAAEGLRVEIDRLNTRLNEIDSRLTPLLTSSVNQPDEENILSLKTELDRVNESLTMIGPRLTRLENRMDEMRGRSVKAVSAEVKAPSKASTDKGWYIVLASLSDRKAAEKLQQSYRKKGVEAEIVKATVKNKPWFRLRAGPFPSQKAANVQATQLKSRLGLTSVWLSR